MMHLRRHSSASSCRTERKSSPSYWANNQFTVFCVPFLRGSCMQAEQPFVCLDPAGSQQETHAQLQGFRTRLCFATSPLQGLDEEFSLLCTLYDVLDANVIVYQRRNSRSPTSMTFAFDVPILFGVSTSGTTGTPKRLAVPLQCFLPNVTELELKYHMTGADVVYLSAPPTFDPFVLDLLIAVRSAATVCMASAGLRHSPPLLVPLLLAAGLSVVPLTPSLFTALHGSLLEQPAAALRSLRLLLIGGEAAPATGAMQRLHERHGAPERLRFICLYGLTECSCWSMAHEVTAADLGHHRPQLPLGELLDADAHWSLYDVHNDTYSERPALHADTTGELVLHSERRFTIRLAADGATAERSATRGRLHTGDLVTFCSSAGALRFQTRADRQIQRAGVRVSIAAIEQHCMQLRRRPKVLAARCVWHQPQAQADDADDASRTPPPLLLLFLHCDWSSLPCVSDDEQRQRRADDDRAVVRHMRRMAPAQRPDRVLCSGDWPLSRHGKFEWLQLWQRMPRPAPAADAGIRLSEYVRWHVCDRLRLSSATHATDDDDDDGWQRQSFVELGGTSFDALHLIGELSSSSSVLTEHQKIPADLLVWLLDSRCSMRRVLQLLREADDQRTATPSLPSMLASSPVPPPVRQPITVRWSCDMHKCVDATATRLRHHHTEYVCVGSHAGVLRTIRAADGVVQSTIRLPTRIEGRVRQIGGWHDDADTVTAAVACCGGYDGRMYAFNFVTGEMLWQHRAGGRIKTRPLPVADGEALVYGSYLTAEDDDEPQACNVWCVEAQTGRERWRRRVGAKSVCANVIRVVTTTTTTDVLVCTLDGTCARLCERTGDVVWQVNVAPVDGGGAVFSTPVAIERRAAGGGCDRSVVVANVTGTVHCLEAASAAERWRFEAGGNIFSALVALRGDSGGGVVFGCQDRFVYCVASDDGVLRWRLEMAAPVFATPLALRRSEDAALLLVCSTGGDVVLVDGQSGRRRGGPVWQMPQGGEIFASPIEVEGGMIVLGSRDNFVYAFDVD